MPKDEWGVKRVCPHCATRFYDLQKDPMTCPSCGNTFDIESLTAKKPGRSVEKKEVVEDEPELEDTDDAVILDDDDSEVDIEDELLDEDDEDEAVDLDDIADVPGEEED